jgi:hypothetical protein
MLTSSPTKPSLRRAIVGDSQTLLFGFLFLSSFRGFSQLPFGTMSIRSYVRSTDCNCESRSQNITTGIDISVMGCSAFWTLPLSDAQWQLIDYKTTVSASLTRWEKAIYLYQFSTVPLAFILKLSNQFSPSSITDATSKRTIFDHVSDSQILNRYYLVFAYQLSRQLMQKIFSRITYFSVNSSHSNFCFFSVLRAFVSSRKNFLRCPEFSIFVIEMFGIGHFFSIRSSNQRGQSSVQANIFSGWWKWLNCWVVNQKRNIPTSRRFEFDGNRRWLAFNRKISTPDNIQRLFAFGKPELPIFPLKSRTSKFSVSAISFLFKVRIFGSFRPEVLKRFTQVAKCLLQRYTANLVKERKLLFFFPESQHRRSLVVADPLLSLIPPLGSGSQSFVVNQTNASHCSTQEILLFERGVKPIFVGAFGHLQYSIRQLSHFNIFSLKIMQKLKYLLIEEASSHPLLASIPPTASLRVSGGLLEV